MDLMSLRDFPSVNGISSDRIALADNEGDSRSGSDNIDAANIIRAGGKKMYQRHTPKQIEELEALFKECPHPDEKQRLKLSKRLGLDGKQVKFWFQNRRTQLKNQMERRENSVLRNENSKLRAENIAVKRTLRNPICPNCGGQAVIADISLEEQHLRIENARLKDEIDRLRMLAGKFLNSAIENELSSLPSEIPAARHVDISADKSVLLELALTAMDELVKMVQTNDPLWLKNLEGLEVLNEEAYDRTFSPCIGPKPRNFVTEASRDTGMAIINSFALAETLMSPGRWAEMFPCMLGRTSTTDVIFHGIDNAWNGSLHLMQAEFRLLSPMVPSREMNFIRFSKRLAEGLWAVVDVSIDHLLYSSCYSASRRLPSGFVVQDMPKGSSKVTWVEHTEYDEGEIHELYRPVVAGGMGFGARRWIATLQRQCECLAIHMSSDLPSPDPSTAITAGGRKSMLKLARRMTESFCAGVCTSPDLNWNHLVVDGMNHEIKVMTRKSVNYPGEPFGLVLCAATSVLLPVSPERLFDFIRDERLRCQWDILSNGDPMQEMAHVAKGHHHGNSVSLLRATALNENQDCMLILQESSTDAAGGLVVYAPVDVSSMHVVMNGGESTCVALLPSGFAILPGPRNGGGSLLTVAFQILVNSVPTSKLNLESVQTVNNLISATIQRLKAAVGC